ncbi:hypothetical protein LCGC14_1253460 [marine sediment metagenome]|uniref:Uncharacterized protein n=1 Tax=marine sediment metagenome TaxID=412755 RepID=A0A0F9LP05_9ZZZZ
MIDLLLTILPRYTSYSDPPAGISILNAVVKKEGFNSKATDFNLIFYKELFEKNRAVWERIDKWMDRGPTAKKEKKPREKVLAGDDRKELNKIFDIWLDIIEKYNPRFVGFSVFTTYSITPALEFIPIVKKRFPNIKIIVGGAGTTPHNKKLYDMVDYYVIGEGENAIIDILNGKDGPGINGIPAEQIDDMDTIPFPDYSDFSLSQYICKGKMLRVTGSRGCVRRCNFCDVYKMWPLFRYRSGNLIAEELFYQWSTLPCKPDMFLFTDSLINGNMKMLRTFCEKLIQLQSENPEFRPKFKGQWIAGSPRFTTIDDWNLLAEAGCDTLFVGVESGSEKLRWAMNKKVKDEWLSYCIEEAYNRDIKMRWFTIIGFPEETDEDFFETVKLYERYKWMNQKENFQINISINEFTLYEVDWVIDHEDEIHYDDNNNWFYEDIIKEKRMARAIFLQKKILEWGYDYRITSLMNFIEDFSELEKILGERYGWEIFGNYDLYLKLKNDLEKKYKEMYNND